MKAFLKNLYLKFCIFSSNYEYKINDIQSLIITRPETTYSHERILIKNKKVIDKFINDGNLKVVEDQKQRKPGKINKKRNRNFF